MAMSFITGAKLQHIQVKIETKRCTKDGMIEIDGGGLVVALQSSIGGGLLLLVMRFRKAHLHRFFRSGFVGVTVDEVQHQLDGPQAAAEAIRHLQQHITFPSNQDTCHLLWNRYWNFSDQFHFINLQQQKGHDRADQR